VIVLDTHIWVWWVHGDEHLNKEQTDLLQGNEEQGLGDTELPTREHSQN
jgi:PIN domain nuclease of toxin-antitoxin system